MPTIASINNSAITGMFQHPPMKPDHKLNDEQKSQLQEILTRYDSENISDEEMKTMMGEIREAGIRPGEDLKNALEDAGFEMKPPREGPPPMGMGKPMGAGTEPPQFVKDFMEKVQSGDISEEDVAEFINNVKSQRQEFTGVILNESI